MSEIIGLLLIFFPLFAIFLLANVAERNRQQEEPYQHLEIISYVLTGVVYMVIGIIGISVQTYSFLAQTNPEWLTELGIEADLLSNVNSVTMLSVGIWVPSLIGILILLPMTRRLLRHIIPIDPDSPIHAISLSLAMLIIINLMSTVGVGLGTLGNSIAENNADVESSSPVITVWVQQVLTALLALIGVGWLTRRSWSETMNRLGLVIPTHRQILLGTGLGFGMVILVSIIGIIGQGMGVGIDPDVEALTEELIGTLFRSSIGIMTLGLAAGLGEETLFRGAIQPRFGLLTTMLLFALVHNNYGLSLSTAIVFMLGLVLGMVRIRYNTTVAMIVHAVYNITLGVLTYVALTYGELPQ